MQTRREFIKRSLLFGGSLLLYPVPLHAKEKKEERWVPAYEKLEREGKLAGRIKQAYSIFEHCQLCPRRCGVNRQKGERGFCRAPVKPVIFSYHSHFGEEMSLLGAYDHPEIARGITAQEFLEAMDWAEKSGLTNFDPQSVAIRKVYQHRRSN